MKSDLLLSPLYLDPPKAYDLSDGSGGPTDRGSGRRPREETGQARAKKLTISCPACRARIRLGVQAQPRKVRCPKCKTAFAPKAAPADAVKKPIPIAGGRRRIVVLTAASAIALSVALAILMPLLLSEDPVAPASGDSEHRDSPATQTETESAVAVEPIVDANDESLDPGDGSIPRLIERLRERGSRAAAVKALERWGPEARDAAPALLEAAAADPSLAQDVGAALLRIGPAGTAAAIDALAHADPGVRSAACEVIRSFEDPPQGILDELAVALGGRNEATLRLALDLLSAHAARSGSAIEKALTGSEELMRDRIVDILLKETELAIPAGGLPTLERRLEQSNPSPRVFRALFGMGPAAAPVGARLLKHPNSSIRWNGLRVVANARPPSIPDLIGLLHEGNDPRKEYVATALGWMGAEAKPAVPTLLEVAGATTGKAPRRAREALVRLGPVALPDVLEACRIDDAETSSGARIVLEAMGPDCRDGSLPLLLEAIRNENDPRRLEWALRALERKRPAPRDVLPALIDMLDRPDADWGSKDTAAQWISTMGPEAEVAGQAVARLYEGRAFIRDLAIVARVRPDRIPELLDQVNRDLSRGVAPPVRALEALPIDMREPLLGRIQALIQSRQVATPELSALLPVFGAAAVPDMIPLIRGEGAMVGDSFAQVKAAEALAAMGPEAVVALPALLETVQADVRRHERMAMFDAIGAMGAAGTSAAPELIRLVEERRNGWEFAAVALARIDPGYPEACLPVLLDMFVVESGAQSLDVQRRRRAHQGLVGLGVGAVPGVMELLNHEHIEVRGRASAVLAEIGPAAVPFLAAGLSDPRLLIREGAAVTLAWIGPPAADAAPALRELLRDEMEFVRSRAREALKRMGQPEEGESRPFARPVPAKRAPTSRPPSDRRKETVTALEPPSSLKVDTTPLVELSGGRPVSDMEFSTDGAAVLYRSQEGRIDAIHVNSNKIAEGSPAEIGRARFVPGTARVVRIVHSKSDEGRFASVHVGDAPPRTFEHVGRVLFSRHGGVVVFNAIRADRSILVVGDREYGPVMGGFERPVAAISDDGRHVAYATLDPSGREGMVVVFDDSPSEPYEIIQESAVSADGSGVAYAARAGGKWVVVLNGRRGEPFDAVASVTISPDGKSVAYVARLEGGVFAVHDGVKIRLETRSLDSAVFVARGGSRIAVAYSKGREKVLLLSPGQETTFEGMGPIAASPDGRTFAVRAWRTALSGKRESVMIVNGDVIPTDLTEDPRTQDIGFSPDGGFLAYLHGPREARIVTIRGPDAGSVKQVQLSDPVITIHQPLIVNSTGTHLVFVADGCLVADGRKDALMNPLSEPRFSADGRSVSFGTGIGTREAMVYGWTTVSFE